HYKLVPLDPNAPDGSKLAICQDEFRQGIEELFERLLAGQTSTEVAKWVNTLPGKLGKEKDWAHGDVVRLARNPRYKGAIREANTVRVLERSTGRRPPRSNSPDQVEWRFDPAQQYVPVEVWDAVNEILERRKAQRGSPSTHRRRCARDPGNRRSGVWPSGAMFCGPCGAKEYRTRGQDSGGARYACSESLGVNPRCWIYITADAKVVQQEICTAVLAELLKLDGSFEALCKEVAGQARQVADGSDGRTVMLKRQLVDVDRKIQNLLKHAEAGNPSPSLRGRLLALEKQKSSLQEQAIADRQTGAKLDPLTPEYIRQECARLRPLLVEAGEQLWPVMRSLVPHIDVYPVEVIGWSRPRLLAEFDLHLVTLLPRQWQAFLRRRLKDSSETGFGSILTRRMRVLISPLPRFIQLAQRVAKLDQRVLSRKQIVEELGCDSLMLSRALKFAGNLRDGEVQIRRLKTLPDRRRVHKAAPGVTDKQGRVHTCQRQEDAPARIASSVLKYHKLGRTPYGIAKQLGCSAKLVRESLAWLEAAGHDMEGAA
ncbi:hypothetical protein LCGC14_1675590, partial [marine sediment metagenome]